MDFSDFIKATHTVIAANTMERIKVERIRITPDLWYELCERTRQHDETQWAVQEAGGKYKPQRVNDIFQMRKRDPIEMLRNEHIATLFGIPLVIDPSVDGYVAEVRL